MARLSPVVFAQLSRAFLETARREVAVAGMLVSMPAYFLVGRSIELAFKSYLLLEGRGETDLKRLSHDLSAALDEAVALGLSAVAPVSAEADAAVRWISPYYDSKDLEYPTQGYKSYPEIRYLVDFANQLLTSLEPRLREWRPSPP
jgi:hypothetical protein